MGYQSTRVQLWAKIAGKTFAIASATTSFELNAIPQCRVKLPLGRSSSDDAAAHRLAKELRQTQPFELWFQGEILEQSAGMGKGWPKDPVRIFHGETTGSGEQRTNEAANYEIAAKHWLVNLDYSSAVSALSHAENPSQYSYHASTYTPGSGRQPTWLPFNRLDINSGTFATDFWEKGIRPVLLDLAGADTLNRQALPVAANLTSNNAAAIESLKKVVNGVKLEIRSDGQDSAAVKALAGTMLREGQRTTYEAFAQQTLWAAIIGNLLPNFMLAIAPRVDDALVVPITPGLKKTYEVKLSTRDYNHVDHSSELYRALRAVGVLTTTDTATGFLPNQQASDIGLGGWYQPPNSATGTILLRQAPGWLTHKVLADRYANKAAGGGGRPVANAMQPAAGNGQPAEQPPVAPNQKLLIDQYAEYLFVYEALRHRRGEVSGKLRFDLAPGSYVTIEGPGEQFIASDGLAIERDAVITRVTSQISAEASTAGTAFSLAYVRSAGEREQAGYGLASPPLWANPWYGAPLMDEFK